MKKKLLIIISTFCLILVLFLCFYMQREYNLLFKDKDMYTLNVSYDKVQDAINNEINGYKLDKNISFESPKVILNPYNNSPLSAIIIFSTDKITGIKLYVNDVFMTNVEESTSHVIPVYGLRENYNNKITLIDDFNNKNDVYIKTDKLINDDFYEYSTINESNEYLFINSPTGKYVIDNDGYISWYADINNLDIDINSDKKIYFIDERSRIIERDYMGKISRTYYNDRYSHSSHRIKKTNNGMILLIDYSSAILFIDYDSGKVLNRISLAEVFKSIDNEFYISNELFYVNYFDYDEGNNTLLISIRGLDTIVNYDLNTNEIIWIFTDNEIFSSKFDKYKINLVNGKYFHGQHTPILIGNLLYVFNNNNFFIEEEKHTSSALIYEINGKEAKQVYSYDSKYVSMWYGSFYQKNDIKNINFGCVFNGDNPNYSVVLDVDKNNNVISKFRSDYLVYQSFRESFYNDITPNYNVDDGGLTIINNEYLDKIKLKYADYNLVNKLKDAIIDETLIEISDDSFDFNIVTTENIEIFFVGSNHKFYNINIDFSTKGTNQWQNDINNFLLQVEGKYAIYLKFGKKYYNTNLVINVY